MRVVIFCHSLVSDWNHGNAHFLRGIACELMARGHAVDVYEPADGWSMRNLVAEHGTGPLRLFAMAYPMLKSQRYTLATLDLNRALDTADLVLVHEWNDAQLVRKVGEHRRRHPRYRLLFHDTHHRSVTDRNGLANYHLQHYDGVLAFGEVIGDIYRERGWSSRVWVWHEAADIRVFKPLPRLARDGDVVWIGNWGDGERTAELREFLIEPVRALKLKARIHGVRYPEEAKQELDAAGIEYAGWLANYEAPKVFARFAATMHVPRKPYVSALPGIPTIRVFEALACGIPLVCAPWSDSEELFSPGEDYLIARSGREMQQQLRAVLNDPALARSLAQHGLETILQRHTCAHRADELLAIHRALAGERGDLHAASMSARPRRGATL